MFAIKHSLSCQEVLLLQWVKQKNVQDNNETTCDRIKSKQTALVNQKLLVVQINIYKKRQTSQQRK